MTTGSVGLELRTALVTGASGAIGPSLVKALLDEGIHVRALVRRPESSRLLPAAAEVVAINDIGDRERLARAIAGVDVVFHLAARLHADTTNADAATRVEYERVNVTATQDLARLSSEEGVRRFIYFSSIAVYGPSRPGQVFDETSPPVESSLYAATKLRGEAAAMDAPSPVVLRLAAVYGPRMKGNYRRLATVIQKGMFLRVGAGTNRRTLVHEQDAAGAAILAAKQAAPRAIYNVTDGRIHTVQDILNAIASAAGRPLLPGYLPARPLRIAVGLVEDVLRMGGMRSPITRAAIDKLIEDVAVSGGRIQNELGFRPRFDLAPGWRDALSTRC